MALELPGWVVIAFNYAGLPWPGIDEDELRAWARSVRKFANNIADNSARTHRVVADLADSSQSSFTGALAGRWEHHNQLVTDLHEPLNIFADALDVAADVVVAQKLAVIGAAITFATEFAATQFGAIVTLGTDEAALPEEIISTREIVDLAMEELKGALIGELLNVAVQNISDHISRFVGNLFGGGLQVVTEYQSLKLSYSALRDAAQTIRGQAAETEATGDTAYAENANRDLEDPGEAEASDSGWTAVVQAVKQALFELALALFKSLPQAIMHVQEDTADAIDNAAARVQAADSAAGHGVPHDSGHGPSAEAVPGGPSPGVETRLDRATAAERAERQLELAADPDQGGKVSSGSLQEAHVIMSLVESGELPGPVTRSPGHGDGTDATGQDWDVKGPRDNVPRPRFDVGSFLEGKIRSEVEWSKENVIIDLTGLTDPANRRALRAAVDAAGLTAHVRWYE